MLSADTTVQAMKKCTSCKRLLPQEAIIGNSGSIKSNCKTCRAGKAAEYSTAMPNNPKTEAREMLDDINVLELPEIIMSAINEANSSSKVVLSDSLSNS
jgi:hypothetical protein